MDIEKKFSHCGDYAILKTLGSGFHAKVKMASKDGQKVAIKIFKSEHSTQTNIKALANEINILKGLKHPNLVNLIEYNDSLPYKKKNGTTEPRVCIILELAQGGELFEYIAQSGRFLPETSRFYFTQLLNALLYMKDKGVCHRDLKLENILLDEGFNLKVADFGFATLLARGKLTSHLGTPGYMAPEIVGKKEYDGTLADVFSAGVILFIMHAGSPPFSAAADKDPYFRLFLTNRQEQFWATHTKFKGGNPEFFPQEFRHLINGMLAPNPAQRFTLEQCINHPWLKGQTNTYEQVRAELAKRKDVVEREQEKERMRKQAQKQQKQGQQPIGRFRSSNTGEEVDFTDIETKYNLRFDNRKIKTTTPTGMLNEIFSLQDPEYLFCYLLKEAEQFNGSVNKIFDDRFKINFDIIEDEEKVAAVEVELQAINGDSDKLRVNVKKLGGDYFKFHDINTKIKQLVEGV